ncbi:MAG: hypothetical protein ACPGUD_11770 [Parashewanella sp.]
MMTKNLLHSAGLASLLFVNQAAISATATPTQATISNVQASLLQSGKGYELKEFTLEQGQGLQSTQHSGTYYFIYSAEGARNAADEAGLPIDERDSVINDFNNGGINACTSSNDACSADSQDPFKLIIIDKDLAQKNSFASMSELNSYIQERGLTQARQNEISKLQAQGISIASDNPMMLSCFGTNKGHKDFDKSFDFPLNKSVSGGDDNASYSLTLNGNANINGKGAVNYAYKTKFCIPYKIQITDLDANANLAVTGNFDIQGQVNGSIQPVKMSVFTGRIASGWFTIGAIPVNYDFRIPVYAGIGKINYRADGEVALKKDINLTANFNYQCHAGSCDKLKATYNDNGSFNKENISYPVMASVDMEPYAQFSIRASLYHDLLWANVGTRDAAPIAFNGYVGNECGNGNGIGDNDFVDSALVSLKLQGDTFAESKLFKTKVWPLFQTAAMYKDLLNPSTALSPIVRSTVNGKEATLTVSVRSCMSKLDSSMQNFTVNWGDGATDSINNVSSAQNLKHEYKGAGDYKVVVTHKNGAATTSNLKVTAL